MCHPQRLVVDSLLLTAPLLGRSDLEKAIEDGKESMATLAAEIKNLIAGVKAEFLRQEYISKLQCGFELPGCKAFLCGTELAASKT